MLEVPGGTVLPGLVDAHVHLCADGTDGTLDRIGEPATDAMTAVIEESLRCHLAAGVTTVRDLGDRRFAMLDWASSARCRSGVYPAVVTAGPPITSVGGHCANMGGEAAGLPVTAHAHGPPAVHMAMAVGVDGIEHCSFLTDTGISQSEEDLARLAAAGTAVCPTVGTAGAPAPHRCRAGVRDRACRGCLRRRGQEGPAPGRL